MIWWAVSVDVEPPEGPPDPPRIQSDSPDGRVRGLHISTGPTIGLRGSVWAADANAAISEALRYYQDLVGHAIGTILRSSAGVEGDLMGQPGPSDEQTGVREPRRPPPNPRPQGRHL